MMTEQDKSELLGLINWGEPEALAASLARLSSAHGLTAASPRERQAWSEFALLMAQAADQLHAASQSRPTEATQASDLLNNPNEPVNTNQST